VSTPEEDCRQVAASNTAGRCSRIPFFVANTIWLDDTRLTVGLAPLGNCLSDPDRGYRRLYFQQALGTEYSCDFDFLRNYPLNKKSL
jgi:hypothetical protein